MTELETSIETPAEPAEDQHVERRREVKRGLKSVETLWEIFDNLGASKNPEISALLGGLEAALDSLRPPDPRRCKEYLRAVGRAKKGLLGIAPEDVALYCRCTECATLRVKLGVTQPSGALEVEAPPEVPS